MAEKEIPMKVEIDSGCGFCTGVKRAVSLAEKHLSGGRTLYCLGELIHNTGERNRLEALGMKFISHSQIKDLKNVPVLIRTHGEPPSTYELLHSAGAITIDATCPVVKHLQQRIKRTVEEQKARGGQLVIIGRESHAEVIGLAGHAGKEVIVIGTENDISKINPRKPVAIYAQTTANPERFERLTAKIREYLDPAAGLPGMLVNQTICRQMSDREPGVRQFARSHDVVVFVSDPMSSNGKMLFEAACEENSRTHFITAEKELSKEWFRNCCSVGISGATSTPPWLLERVAEAVRRMQT